MATAQATLDFIPPVPGSLQLIVDYEATGISGGDWGSNYTVKPYCTHAGTTRYGNTQLATTTRSKYVVQGFFPVTAANSVTCGIEITCTGATAIICNNINIQASIVGGAK